MDFKKTNKYNFIIKMSIIVLSLITPFVMLLSIGKMGSISSYWDSYFQPLFILTNALTTYIFMDLPKWRLSGILLFLLTIFSVEYYNILHTIFAVLFFIVNLYPLYSLKRYRLVIIPYILSCLWLPDFFWFEVQAIIVLCFYHFYLLLRIYRMTNLK